MSSLNSITASVSFILNFKQDLLFPPFKVQEEHLEGWEQRLLIAYATPIFLFSLTNRTLTSLGDGAMYPAKKTTFPKLPFR